MITAEMILNATRGGLDIILELYPQARASVDNPKKKFALRNERTASANLRLVQSSKFGSVWKVTDFGDTSREMNAINLYMHYNNMQTSQYYEALLKLAAEYGVKDTLNRDVNKAKWEQRAALDDEHDGCRKWATREATKKELELMGPLVTAEHMNVLGWQAVEWISYTKDGKTSIRYSTETYPIFIRKCVKREATTQEPEDVFYKIYEPLNPDKAFRFSYYPNGGKPRDYINGLIEMQRVYAQINVAEANAQANSGEGDGMMEQKVVKEKKLSEVVICSGERDALCCRSMGFVPLWLNSETAALTAEQYAMIRRYAELIYNIPDLDNTGKRLGAQLALRYIDIHTLWLPEWMSDYKDNRGRGRKDLRDYCELRPDASAFKRLLKMAMPAKFWTYNKDGKPQIDTACLYHFLMLNGFYSLREERGDDIHFVRIVGNKVKMVSAREIREFVVQWVRDRYEDRDVVNLVLNSMRFGQAAMESLQSIELNFTNYTQHSQLFFLQGQVIKVTDGWSETDRAIEEYKDNGDDVDCYVWDRAVIPHRIKVEDDFFKVKEAVAEDGTEYLDLKIERVPSKFMGFIINSSRIYWRKEMETRFGSDVESMKRYRERMRFCIDGDGLTAKEIREQKQNMLSKMFCFGYMLHRYKSLSRAWAPMAMDSRVGEIGECNGRSGKSFFFSTLANVLHTVKLSGRNPKLMDNPHVFDRVTPYTNMMLVDDCAQYLEMGLFYDNITSDMTVNPKNKQSFTIAFKDSPKLAFTTNYVPNDFSPSTEARSLYLVFSDYYHQKTEENNYLETRTIRDDFDKDLYDSNYTEAEWQADINFFLQCLRFYLWAVKRGMKIQPPMENIMTRKLKSDMGDNFEEWAIGYFTEDGDHVNKYIVKEDVFNDYLSYARVGKLTMQRFSKKLQSFCNYTDYIECLNPADLCGSRMGRIQKRVFDGKRLIQKDMIYVRTVGAELNYEMDIEDNVESF